MAGQANESLFPLGWSPLLANFMRHIFTMLLKMASNLRSSCLCYLMAGFVHCKYSVLTSWLIMRGRRECHVIWYSKGWNTDSCFLPLDDRVTDYNTNCLVVKVLTHIPKRQGKGHSLSFCTIMNNEREETEGGYFNTNTKV